MNCASFSASDDDPLTRKCTLCSSSFAEKRYMSSSRHDMSRSIRSRCLSPPTYRSSPSLGLGGWECYLLAGNQQGTLRKLESKYQSGRQWESRREATDLIFGLWVSADELLLAEVRAGHGQLKACLPVYCFSCDFVKKLPVPAAG